MDNKALLNEAGTPLRKRDGTPLQRGNDYRGVSPLAFYQWLKNYGGGPEIPISGAGEWDIYGVQVRAAFMTLQVSGR